MTSHKKNYKNYLWSFFGQGLPAIAMLLCIGKYLSQVGETRFGVFSLLISISAFLGILDLGISKVVSIRISKGINNNEPNLINGLLFSMLIVYLGISIILTAAIVIINLEIVKFLNIPELLKVEFSWSLYILCIIFPITIIDGGLRSAIEAFGRFDESNKINAANGIGLAIIPLTFSYVNGSLPVLMAGVLVTRVLTVYARYNRLKKLAQNYRNIFSRAKTNSIKKLLLESHSFSLLSFIGAAITYWDRILISSLLGGSIIVYYTLPIDIATKIWLVPIAVVSVTFPRFAVALSDGTVDCEKITFEAQRLLYVMIFPIILIGITYADKLLNIINIGHEFTKYLQIALVGVFISNIGQVFYSLMLAAKLANQLSFIHIVEALIYFPLLYYFSMKNGVEGALIVWTCRILIDTFILYIFSKKIHKIHFSILIIWFISGIYLTLPIIYNFNIYEITIYILSALIIFSKIMISILKIDASKIIDYFKI